MLLASLAATIFCSSSPTSGSTVFGLADITATPTPTTTPTASDPPAIPDGYDGHLTAARSSALNWNNVIGATSYQLRTFYNGRITLLPVDAIIVQFFGSSAQISRLPDYSNYFLAVRAVNSRGTSDWTRWLPIYYDPANIATATPTPTPTATPTASPTTTPTPTATSTPTSIATATPTNTPLPSSGSIVTPTSACLPPAPTQPAGGASAPSPRVYPKLRGLAEHAVRAYEEARAQGATGQDGDETKFVVIRLHGLFSHVVTAFLAENGVVADQWFVERIYVQAYVPVRLLGPLSELPEVMENRPC